MSTAEKKGLAGFPKMDAYRLALQESGAMDIEMPIRVTAESIADSTLDSDAVGSTISASNPGVIKKVVHFQRHGQGFHNLLGTVWKEHGRDIDIHSTDPLKNPYVRPELLDAPLTDTGRSEAVQQRAVASQLSSPPQVVFVSPLVRAIQTAKLTFHTEWDQSSIPWLADERCREDMGLYSCNQCRPLSQVQADFPRINFDSCRYGEEDSLFNPARSEPFPDQARRVYDFLLDLKERPEDSILVVCHSAWLFCAFNCVIQQSILSPSPDPKLITWFDTSEIRTVELTFHEAESEQ